MFRLLSALVVCCLSLRLVAGPSLNSRQAILIDLTTNTILFEKNADEKSAPSSISKLMTAYVIFDALKRGDIDLGTMYTVSEKAWRKGGSKMFIKIGSEVSVGDLLKGLIIQSGNDAAIALAEGYAGSEEVFAEQANRKAKEIGMVNSYFANSTGWPDPNHMSTVRDLATLSIRTIKDFPEYYPMYREKEFTFNGITQQNRNPLLHLKGGNNMGADGLKTGRTDDGGFGLAASAIQGDRRLVLVINGAKTAKDRAKDADALMGYGFTAFISPKVLRKGHEMDRAEVWLGDEKNVPLVVDRDVFITIPRDQLSKLKVDLIYKTPIEAPIKAFQDVGRVVITLPDSSVQDFPLKAAKAVDKIGFFGRISSAITYLLRGHN